MNYLEHQIVDANFSKVANLGEMAYSGAKSFGRGTARVVGSGWRNSDIDGKTFMAGMPIAAGLGMYARKRLADRALAAGKSAPKMGYGKAGLYAAGGLAGLKLLNDYHTGMRRGTMGAGEHAGLGTAMGVGAIFGNVLANKSGTGAAAGLITKRGLKGAALGAGLAALPLLYHYYNKGKMGSK
jgi:hypothetical protein